MSSSNIVGANLIQLTSHGDQRGFFREVVRCDNDWFSSEGLDWLPFGQWSHSKMTQGVVKAWHYHHIQTDWWYVPVGVIKAVIYDNRESSPSFGKLEEYYLGDEDASVEDINTKPAAAVLKIPPGVLHGCRVLSPSAHLMYITSHTYNPDDEGRFPFNAGPVDYDWGENPITSENDRKAFIPTAPKPLSR